MHFVGNKLGLSDACTALTRWVLPAAALATLLALAVMQWWDAAVRARWPWLSLQSVAYALFSIGALLLQHW